MSNKFRISPMQDSTILLVYSIRDSIQIDPSYQRLSDIWPLDKQQLLIDSIVNGFDIPKLYFHEFVPMKEVDEVSYQYAIIDGKQRLQAIWKFLNNEFALPDNFEYLDDKRIKLGGMTYSDIANKYQNIKIRFDSKVLPIITVQTDDTELIEDLFSRLNEAVPLSAPEKRNAFGGPLPKLIRNLSKNAFFVEKLPFSNTRYRHFDLATKYLFFEYQNYISQTFSETFADTKKIHLDEFVKDFRKKQPIDPDTLFSGASKVTKNMAKIFINKDPLLSSMGTVVLYYFVFKFLSKEKWFSKIDRSVFMKFEKERTQNRLVAEKIIESADYKLLEYDRMISSPNDAYSMKYRFDVLCESLRRELNLS